MAFIIFYDSNKVLRINTWTEFKKYIDGTFSSLAFFFIIDGSRYHIVTEEQGGHQYEILLPIDGGADQIDFENNFKILPPRKPGSNTRSVSATSTNTSSVSASISNINLLSTNISRLGATILNDSTSAILYIKLGTIASLTDYTVKLFPTGYYEVPYGYTGNIDGIWNVASGNARITELS